MDTTRACIYCVQTGASGSPPALVAGLTSPVRRHYHAANSYSAWRSDAGRSALTLRATHVWGFTSLRKWESETGPVEGNLQMEVPGVKKNMTALFRRPAGLLVW